MSDSFCAFKFHSTSPKSTNTSPATPRMATISSRSHPCCICTQCTQLLTLNQHLGEQGTSSAGGFHVNSQQTSRWSPTPAQLLVLEELYRQGTRTPTAEQIQQIASQLRRFGKIEGKNVFYWFQNHKARERQKRRRREMETTAAAAAAAEEKDQYIMRSSEKQQEAAGLRTTGDEVKETKKWASTSNYCNRLTEESASLDIAEREANGWTQFKEREAKCQNIHMISCSLPNLCRNTSTTTATSVATTHRTPTISRYYNLPFILNTENIDNYDDDDEELNDKDNRTLELFPLRRDSQDGVCHTEGNNSKFCNISASINSTEMNCNQFFEFLPLKD